MRAAGLLLAVVVVGGGATGCGLATDERPSFVADDDVPFGLLGSAPPGTAAPAAPGSLPATICFTGADGRVHPVGRLVAPGHSLDDLLDQLTAGPTDDERRYGLSTTLTEPGAVVSITTGGGVATVDLDASVGALPGTDQLEAVAQIVCTLTAQPGIGQVLFRVDGRSISVPRGDGSTTSDPVSRLDYGKLIAADG